jgi:hypothetical protein
MKPGVFAQVALALGVAACSPPAADRALFGSAGAGGAVYSYGGQTAAGAPSSGGYVSAAGSPASSAAGSDPGIFTVGPVQSNDCSNHDIDVLFVIDRSGSMNCNLPPITASSDCEAMSPPAKVDPAQPSKWEIITQALSGAVTELGMLDGSVRLHAGVSFFSVDGVCGATSTPTVPVDVATASHLDLIRQAMSRQVPKGGTPIVGATVLGYKHLYQAVGVTTNAHVILITDGQDSCGAYYGAQPSIGPGDQVSALITKHAPTALNVGIKTWVIGAPGSEVARATLSNLAVAGGTRRTDDCTPGTAADPTVGNCHYDMTTGDFQSALSTALDHILAVVTCRAIR